jgi:hypothetical protein
MILKVDLYGTALVLEEFGNVIARGGSGVVIASQSGRRLPPLSTEQNAALATTPVEELLKLPFLQPDQVKNSLHAYQLSIFTHTSFQNVETPCGSWPRPCVGESGVRGSTQSAPALSLPHLPVTNWSGRVAQVMGA